MCFVTENTKPSVTSHGPHFVRSVLCDFGLSIFQYGLSNKLINRQYYPEHLDLKFSFPLDENNSASHLSMKTYPDSLISIPLAEI